MNGEIILLSDLQERIAMLSSFKGRGNQADVTEKEAINSMIDEKVILKHAREKELRIEESEIDKSIENVITSNKITMEILEGTLKEQGMEIEQYREKMRDQMLIQRVTSMEVPKPEVSDEEVKSAFNKNKNKFFKPGKVRASHIVLLASREKDPDYFEEAQRRIIGIMEKIRGGADFAGMAKEYSQDGAAKDGGDLGWFGRGKMIPEFEKLTFSLRKGEVGGPVETIYGLHLIKVTDIEEPEPIPFEQLADKIRDKLAKEDFERKRNTWIENLRSHAYIERLN